MYFDEESDLTIVDLTLANNMVGSDYTELGDMYDGGGGNYVCTKRCSAGQFASCKEATGNLSPYQPCYANCGACKACPAGRSKSATGSTTSSACVDCATGYVSEAGATNCSACQVSLIYAYISQPLQIALSLSPLP